MIVKAINFIVKRFLIVFMLLCFVIVKAINFIGKTIS